MVYQSGTNRPNVLYSYGPDGTRLSKTKVQSNGLKEQTLYIRDASGNILATYEVVNVKQFNPGEPPGNRPPIGAEYSRRLKETAIYGSSRLGMKQYPNALWQVYAPITTPPDSLSEGLVLENRVDWYSVSDRGGKYYEQSNHLGNVLAVVMDKKLYDITSSSYAAQVVSATDYFPFGWSMPDRSFSAEEYRFGFNGMEKNPEITASNYDFGARCYDGRVGRWWSVDPLESSYPSHSAYVYGYNSPIIFTAPSGNDPIITITKDLEGNTEITLVTNVYLTNSASIPDVTKGAWNRVPCVMSSDSPDGVFRFKNKDNTTTTIKLEVNVIELEGTEIVDPSTGKTMDIGDYVWKNGGVIAKYDSENKRPYHIKQNDVDEVHYGDAVRRGGNDYPVTGENLGSEIGHDYGLADQYLDTYVPGTNQLIRSRLISEYYNTLMGTASAPINQDEVEKIKLSLEGLIKRTKAGKSKTKVYTPVNNAADGPQVGEVYNTVRLDSKTLERIPGTEKKLRAAEPPKRTQTRNLQGVEIKNKR